MIPAWLTDQEEKTIKAHGYSFRDFSAEQVMAELYEPEIPTLMIHDQLSYEDFVTYRYESNGYVKHKSTSIAGGYIWKKPTGQ
jgi:hypothetical protein